MSAIIEHNEKFNIGLHLNLSDIIICYGCNRFVIFQKHTHTHTPLHTYTIKYLQFNKTFFERKILLENQQKLKTTLFTKYIHICTSHHQLYIHVQTPYIIPNVVFTMVKKAFIKWTAIEESSSTYIRGLSKINANILGI